MLVENGGKIETYSMLSANMVEQMKVSGREGIEEFLLGSGFLKSKS